MLSLATFAILATVGLVRAHGTVATYEIAGQNITSSLPYQCVLYSLSLLRFFEHIMSMCHQGPVHDSYS